MITAATADPRSTSTQNLIEEAEVDEEIALLDEDFCREEEDDRDNLQKAQPQCQAGLFINELNCALQSAPACPQLSQ